MTNRIDKAMECFDQGFNCSQSILSAYCDELGLDRELALKLSCSMGAGMGRLQETCGAVTGAYLVISIKYGNSKAVDCDAREKTYQLVQEFQRQFAERNGSANCRELLGVDLRYDDKEKAVCQVKRVCPNVVKDAVDILEVIL